MLFFWITTLATLLISLRTALISTRTTDLDLFYDAIVYSKLVLVTIVFAVELLGPDGWDGTTWRDWVPFVRREGQIKLGDDESEGKEKEQPPCPRLRANIFSVLTFSWLTPMMKAGKDKYLTEEDLWSLPVSFSSPPSGFLLTRFHNSRMILPKP